MAPKKTAAVASTSADRAARRASAKPSKKAAAPASNNKASNNKASAPASANTKKNNSKKENAKPAAPETPVSTDLTTTTEATPTFLQTTTTADPGMKEKKDATIVPMTIIRSLQEDLKSQNKKYSQEELKTILDTFWHQVMRQLYSADSGHKVSFMNMMTMRLVFRDGQVFTPPKNSASKGTPAPVTKPPRWHLSVNIKERLKKDLETEFQQQHSDVVSAFSNGSTKYQDLAVSKQLVKNKKFFAGKKSAL